MPDLALRVPTWEPLPTIAITVSNELSATLILTGTITAAMIRPVQTLTAWSGQQFGPNGWERGTTAASPFATYILSGLGWLTVFTLLGQLNWLLPPILISVLIRVVKVILSIVKYIKQIIPVAG